MENFIKIVLVALSKNAESQDEKNRIFGINKTVDSR